MAKPVEAISGILLGAEFDKLIFKSQEAEFRYKDPQQAPNALTGWLDSYLFAYELSGKIVTVKRVSKDKLRQLFPSYQHYFLKLGEEPTMAATQSGVVLDIEQQQFFWYDHLTGKESAHPAIPEDGHHVKNYLAYRELLALFTGNEALVEFCDTVKQRMLVIDNGLTKSIAMLTYALYDSRIFSKVMDSDVTYIADRVNNKAWTSSFKHAVVMLINSQQESNRTFTEIFLNLQYLARNADNDYEVYIREFSFEKVSKEHKDDKQRYFDQLNAAQDKIKSQVIAVPLSVGASVYAFFQLQTSVATLYFLLVAIGVYMTFIGIYLWLYDRDLRHLQQEIQEDAENFKTHYEKIYAVFERDYTYIKTKVRDVLWLSNAIKIILLIDWLIFLAYILFFFSPAPAEGIHLKFDVG